MFAASLAHVSGGCEAGRCGGPMRPRPARDPCKPGPAGPSGRLDNRGMQASRPSPSAPATRTWPERLFGRWWRRQSAARQDRYATLGPLVSVMLFLAAIISAFWYLRNEE